MIRKEYDMCIIISHIDEIKNQKGNMIKIHMIVKLILFKNNFFIKCKILKCNKNSKKITTG